jgi:hypothetical protein
MHPPGRAARFTAGALLTAIQIGGLGSCTGRMFMRTSLRWHEASS